MRSDDRVARLRERLTSEGIAAFAALDTANVAYLTGFDGVFDEERAHIAVITERMQALYTDNRYAEAARGAATGSDWEVRVARLDQVREVSEALATAGAADLAVEDTVSKRTFTAFADAFTGEASASRDWVETLRIVKEPAEIERIAEAQRLTDAALEHILEILGPGMTERTIALEVEFFMRREGSDGVAFPPIVASGPNSALPHAKVTDRVIGLGDFVKMDFGARVDGYCADMTRTVVVGTASERQRMIYEAVAAANAAGITAVVAGVTGREVDTAARTVLEQAGLGPLFTHGLGHGVGLEVHELPVAGPRAEGVLPEGSVLTIEPGVYEPGFGGVRIEDLVVVEATGARVLTQSPKDLIEL